MNNERYNGYRYSLSNLQETTIAVSVFKVLFIVHFLYPKNKTRSVTVTERVLLQLSGNQHGCILNSECFFNIFKACGLHHLYLICHGARRVIVAKHTVRDSLLRP